MRKIPSLFVRHDATSGKSSLVTPTVTPGCEWVIKGEGIATRKWDGTAVLVRNGILFKRFDAKKGKAPPANFEACQDPDPLTGHWPGWVPAYPSKPEDRWINEAFARSAEFYGSEVVPDGTYEACGPKIGGNPEGFTKHELRRHGYPVIEVPRTFLELGQYLADTRIEGIVWHLLSEGAPVLMAKIKARDFGLAWPRG